MKHSVKYIIIHGIKISQYFKDIHPYLIYRFNHNYNEIYKQLQSRHKVIWKYKEVIRNSKIWDFKTCSKTEVNSMGLV